MTDMDQTENMEQDKANISNSGTEGGGSATAGGVEFVKLRVLSQDGNEVQFR